MYNREEENIPVVESFTQQMNFAKMDFDVALRYCSFFSPLCLSPSPFFSALYPLCSPLFLFPPALLPSHPSLILPSFSYLLLCCPSLSCFFCYFHYRRFLFKFRLPGEAQKIDRLMEKVRNKRNASLVFVYAFSLLFFLCLVVSLCLPVFSFVHFFLRHFRSCGFADIVMFCSFFLCM